MPISETKKQNRIDMPVPLKMVQQFKQKFPDVWKYCEWKRITFHHQKGLMSERVTFITIGLVVNQTTTEFLY